MKPGLFSFIGNDFENLFQFSDLFLPGISRIEGIYHDPAEKHLRIISREKNGNMESQYDHVFQKRENMVMIQKFRADNKPFVWIHKSELAFDLNAPKTRINSPDLFTEIENSILVLRFKNDADQLSDLLLIHFNQNLGNFGLAKSDKMLSVDNKSIIGYLLYYQFKSILTLNQENRKLLLKLNHGVQAVIKDNLMLRDSLQQMQANYGDYLITIAMQQLAKMSREYGRNYILVNESLEKIRTFKGSLKHLPQILENAVIFTENLLSVDEDEDIKIHPYSLDFDSYQVDDKTESSTRKIDSRESRAVQLLDKLERAAIILKSKGIPMTSARVGQAMDQPVSAPAITDALGKNRNLIKILIDKYPEKWENIRHDFKPLQNQLNKDLADDVKEESA